MKNKNLLIGALLVVVLVMSVAFAALAANLQINGTAHITSSWNVQWDTTKTSGASVISTTTGLTGATAPTGTVSYTDTTHANVSATLNQPGDRVVFTLTIKNTGSIAATLGTPTISSSTGCSISGLVCTSTSGHIKFTVGSPASNSLAATTGTTTMTVTAEYPQAEVTSQAAESASIVVGITATQA